MKPRNVELRLEHVVCALVILVAAGLRLGHLDWPPLDNPEAIQALGVLDGTAQASPFWTAQDEAQPSNPVYYVVTSLVFQFLAPGEGSARLASALFGMGLVLLPLLLRRQLGAGVTLVTIFLLATSSSQVAVARTAGSPAPAVFGLMLALALGFLVEGQWRKGMALVGLGLALAGGPSVWSGLLGLGVGAALASARGVLKVNVPSLDFRLNGLGRYAWVIPVVTLASATGFGLVPAGASALWQSLSDWLQGWGTGGGVPVLTMLAALPAYEPLILVLGIAGAVVGVRRRDRWAWYAMWWAVGALAVVLLYPARRPVDLIWVFLPLSLLAAKVLAELADRLIHARPWPIMGVVVAVLLLLSAFAYMQLTSFEIGIGRYVQMTERQAMLVIIAAAVGLVGLVISMFGLGWSWQLALDAGGLAGTIVLTAFSISAGWRLWFGPTAASGRELWKPQASTRGLTQVVETLRAVSVAETGLEQGIELQVGASPPPSLAWAVRGFRLWQESPGLDGEQVPALLLPLGVTDPALGTDYAGQTVIIGETWGWQGALPPDPILWLVDRTAPTQPDRWLLLVRKDIADLGKYIIEPGET